MSVNLPYPALDGAFTITGANVDVFSPSTVHTDAHHNNPHAKLLQNDIELKAAVDGISGGGVLTRIPMREVYRINNVAFSAANMPPEFVTAGSVNMGNNGTWQTHSYDDGIVVPPYIIPTPAISVIMQIFIGTSSSSAAYARFKTASLFPDAVVAESYSRANSDDTCANTVLIEMPYETARTFQSYCHIKAGSGACILFVVGYRS